MSIANAKTTTLHAMPLLSLFLWLCEVGAGLTLKHWVDSKNFCTSSCCGCGCGCGSRAGSGPLTGGFEVPEVETVQCRPQQHFGVIFEFVYPQIVSVIDLIKIFLLHLHLMGVVGAGLAMETLTSYLCTVCYLMGKVHFIFFCVSKKS